MRLAEICIDGRSCFGSLAVWSEAEKGWLFISDLFKQVKSPKDTRYLSAGLMLYRNSSYDDKDVDVDDIRRALSAYEAKHLGKAKAYKPGVDGSEYATLYNSPSKILCVGLNYADHAKEFGDPLPTEPVIFNKAPSAVNYCGGTIVLPKSSSKVDYEGELVIVIGDRCRDVEPKNALKYVAGYCCGNDVSARDWQKEKPAGQWFLGKSFDSFAPIGPAFVSADEVGDPNNLKIETRLNGEVVQSSNTSNFIFKPDFLISYLSKIMTLYTGDLIFTGTPGGVGDARKPPRYLKQGDFVEVEIEKIGVLRNKVGLY